MPRQYRLDDLRLRCQRRSNKENDPSIATPEWNMMISEQYGDLYSEVEKTGMLHFRSTLTITASGAANYAAPADYLATIALNRIINVTTGDKRPMDELMIQEESRWAGQIGDAQCFTLIGSTITLYPNPSSGTYELQYMPQSPDLSTAADSTQVDVVNADGEAFLIFGVAVKALMKAEADVQLYMVERESARKRLVEWATLKAFTQPRRPQYRRSINERLAAGDWVDDPGGFWETPPR